MIESIEKIASEPQLRYMRSLLQERDIDGRRQALATAEMVSGTMTSSRAHEILSWLEVQPRREQAPEQPKLPVVDGPGVYLGASGKLYSAALVPNRNFLAFRVVALFGDRAKLVKVFHRVARTDIEDGGHRLTEQEADQYGHQYGVNGHSFCVVCGRLLTADESRKAGIGPVCRSKTVWA